MGDHSRLSWWRDAKFGMFIHWGVYSKLAGAWAGAAYPGLGEWIMYKARIPVTRYAELARQVHLPSASAEDWVRLAVDSGMKYLVFTAKHHDGVALFESQADGLTLFDRANAETDMVKQLSQACARHQLPFGVYYSQAQDWTSPGGAIWQGPHEGDPVWEVPQWDPLQHGDFDRYFSGKVLPQVTELLTRYGPIALVWFDTPLREMNPERAMLLQDTVRRLQPQSLVSGRLSEEWPGDYLSMGDNEYPEKNPGCAWECPATMNHTWGFKSDDLAWKSAREVLFRLVDVVSKGGNYLLNIGPDGQGQVPESCEHVLRTVGSWLRKNGEAIYGTGPSPFGAEFGVSHDDHNAPVQEWRCPQCGVTHRGHRRFTPREEWRCTQGKDCLYVVVFRRPPGGLRLPLAERSVFRVVDLETGTAMPFALSDEELMISSGDLPAFELATVVKLELATPQDRPKETA